MFFIYRPAPAFPHQHHAPFADQYQPSAEERYYRQLAEEHSRRADLALRLAQQERQRVLRDRELRALRARQYQEHLARQTRLERQQRMMLHRPSSQATDPMLDLISSLFGDDVRDRPSHGAHCARRSAPSYCERPTTFFEHIIRNSDPSNDEQDSGATRVRFAPGPVAPAHTDKKDKGKAKAPVQDEPAEPSKPEASRQTDPEPSFWDFFGGLQALREEDALVRQLNSFGTRSSYPGAAQQGVAGPSGTKHPTSSQATAPKSTATPSTNQTPTAPTPATPSSASSSPKSHAASFTSLDGIQSRFDDLKSAFIFPATAEFEDTASTSSGVPRLSYTSSNASVHEYENELNKLLTKLDAIDSDGAESIRGARKALVVAVEEELDRLDEEKKTAWRNSLVLDEAFAAASESVDVTEALDDDESSTVVAGPAKEVRGYDIFEPTNPASPVDKEHDESASHVESVSSTTAPEATNGVETRELDQEVESLVPEQPSEQLTADEDEAVPSQAPQAEEHHFDLTDVTDEEHHSDAEVFVEIQQASPAVSEASLSDSDHAEDSRKDTHASDDEFEML